MRKVLLATTALVAMSVTGAQAADLSITGSHQTAYIAEDHTTNGDADSMAADGNLKFKATTTTESGMTITGYTSLGSHTGSEEDSYVQIVDDFGTIMLGGADAITDGMDGSITAYSTPENFGAGTLTAPVLMSGAGARLSTHSYFDGDVKANFKTQAMSMGSATAQLGVTANPGVDGLATQLVVSTPAFSFGYGMDEYTRTASVTPSGGTAQPAGEYTSSMLGLGVTFGDINVKFADGDAEYKTAAGVSTNKVGRSEYGVVYKGMADSTLYYTVSEEKETQAAAETFTHTHIGMMYTVAPGLTLKVENGTEELATAATQSTYNAVGLSFAF
jgi:hypothetical protein